MEIFDKIPLYEKMDWKIDLYESILEKSKSFPLIKAVFEGWDSNTTEGLEMIGEKTALCLEEILRSKEGKSEIELFHESIINKKNSFEKYIRKEVVRLLAMGKNAECKEENERIENEIKAIFKVPLVIGEFLNLLDNLLSTLGWSNGITLKIRMSNFFLQKIEEMDKRNLSEEVLKAIDKAVGVYKKIKAKEEISENEKFEANKVIEDLPKLLFPMIEKQIKEIVI
jgi:hypothetical protein